MSLMLKMLLIALFVALFSSTCLSYSTGTSLWEPDTSAFTVRTASANLSYGDSFVVFTPGSTKEAEKEYGQIFSDPAPVDLTSQPLSALTWAIFAKISRGALNFSSNQQQNLNGLLEFSFRSGKDMLHAITEQSLWILVKVWCAIYFATIKIIWHFVHHFTMPTLALILLTCATMLVYRMVSWLCSKFPVFLITFPWTIMKYMITKRPKEVKEKACEGFVTFSIPQSPPRNSIVEISYQDGSHAGYATCVKLHNGHNGLLTAQHVCGSEDMAVHSLRNGQKIKLGLFKPLFSNAELDLALYMGPPSWESSLGCSGVDIVCAKRLALSDVRHFRFENEWRSYNGKVTGSNQRKATVLSNTRAGDSGSAYFNGKTVVGVHTGFPDSGENFNLMAPIPDIPGLTTSKLVFETTAPQGKIFDEDDLKYFEELLEDFGISEARSIMRARKGLESSTQNQGNEKRSTACGTNGAPNIQKIKRESTTTSPPPSTETPSQPPVSISPGQEEMMGKILEALVNRINLVDIEKRIIERVSTQVMKNKSRGTRGGNRRPATLESTSQKFIAGKYQPPHSKSPGSVKSELPPSTTTQSRKKKVFGGVDLRSNTQSWRVKQPVSAGPSSGQKQS
ncbi:TPA_asm: P1 protein [Trachyspermum ammi polerovirus]|uniref:P1 protein n=1 Tax=Trachyspermum ammi polerovirus TaxID=2885089 RepID=A0AAD2QFX8_9VIRU|nr:TPA_asm: P1 protein [Trachyspermum ammi polerovirus]